MRLREAIERIHPLAFVVCLIALLALPMFHGARAQGPQVTVGKGIPTVPYATSYASNAVGSTSQAFTANTVNVSPVWLPALTFSKITVYLSTVDAVTTDFYSVGICAIVGNNCATVCSWTATNMTAANAGGSGFQAGCSQGTVTINGGNFALMMTGNAATAKLGFGGTGLIAFSPTATGASSGGAMPASVTVTAGATSSGFAAPSFLLN